MYWREASAASKAGELGNWWNLPPWWRAWIVAVKEIETDINNLQMEGIGEK